MATLISQLCKAKLLSLHILGTEASEFMSQRLVKDGIKSVCCNYPAIQRAYYLFNLLNYIYIHQKINRYSGSLSDSQHHRQQQGRSFATALERKVLAGIDSVDMTSYLIHITHVRPGFNRYAEYIRQTLQVLQVGRIYQAIALIQDQASISHSVNHLVSLTGYVLSNIYFQKCHLISLVHYYLLLVQNIVVLLNCWHMMCSSNAQLWLMYRVNPK